MDLPKVRTGSEYFAVMPYGLKPVPEGHFRYMDAKDVKGLSLYAIYVVRAKKQLHKGQVFILRCIDVPGEYSCDAAFVEQYLFESVELAKKKIKNIVKSRIRRLNSQLNLMLNTCSTICGTSR